MDSQDNIDIEERKRKQAYLKDQILAKGYDGLRFSEYMCAIKPGTQLVFNLHLLNLPFFEA